MIADPAHYKDYQTVVGVNLEYANLKKSVKELTSECDELIAEAERLKQEFRRAQEELDGERFGVQ
jgi:hypothetical protein